MQQPIQNTNMSKPISSWDGSILGNEKVDFSNLEFSQNSIDTRGKWEKALSDFMFDTKDWMGVEEAISLYPEYSQEYIWDLMFDINNWADETEILNLYPEVSWRNTSPDLITKSENSFKNFAWGSATWLIETAWLWASALEFDKRADTLPLNIFYKTLPDSVKDVVKPFLSEDIIRDNPFEGVLSPLEASTQLKEDTQRALWVDTEATATTVGEFLTPDTYLWIWTLFKSGVKLAPKVISWVRTNIWNAWEYFVKLAWGLRKGSIEPDLKLLTENPKKALEQMNITNKELSWILDEIKVSLPKDAAKEIDQIEKIKMGLKAWVIKESDKLAEESATASISLRTNLETIADKARENIAEKSANLKITWAGYRDFVWKQSTIKSEELLPSIESIVNKKYPNLSTPAQDAFNVVKKEINTISENSSWLVKYEEFQQLRKNIDDNINWWDLASSTKNKWLKTFRWMVDDNLVAKEFPEVKVLDEKFAKEITELEDIKKVLGKNWEESEGFRKSLINLHKEWNEVALNKKANLIWVSPEELKAISKWLSEQKIKAWSKTNIDSTISKIDRVENIEQLSRVSKDLWRRLKSKELETLSKKNTYSKNMLDAINADADKALFSKKPNTNENLIATVFNTLEVDKWTKAWGQADVALSLLKQTIWEDSYKTIQLAKSIFKIKETPNESTFASLLFNLAPVKLPMLWPVLKKFVWQPEQALEYVLKRANRIEARRIKELKWKMNSGKQLLPKEVEELWETLLKYDFWAKTAWNLLDNE